MTPGYYYNPKLPYSNLFFITGAISKEGYFEYHELDHHNQGYRTVCDPSSPRVLGAHLIQASTTCDFPAFLREHPELTI